MRRKKNITLNLKNMTPHFTGKEKIITLISVIIMLSFSNIINTSALSYQSSVGVGFTFNPTLSVSISPSDLTISNLAPGTASDSNTINVSVVTNAAYGYTLSAVMYGDNNNLIHTNSIDTFSSIATNADLSDLEDSEDTNIWGYSYKDNTVDTPTWSNYNGLSSSVSKTLLDTNTNNTETGIDSIDFKIAAKANETQPSGTYTGVINFTAVSNVAPMSLLDSFITSGAEQLNGYFKMQDMTHDICESVDIEESELQLIDVRDNKVYWVAKLKDGNCWMTQNLDIAGGTEITSEFSDIPENYTLPTANGFLEGNKLPASSQTGFSNNTKAYVYNSGKHTSNCSSPGCYSYYSWIAVTAGSGVNITTDNNAPYSICPKNWKLPNQANFENLIYKYTNFYNNAGPGTIPNFLISKCYHNNSFCSSQYGNYWSSTSYDNSGARHFYFNSSNSRSPYTDAGREYGLAARCLAK